MCVVCVPQTPAMILIYKSSLKPFPHSGSKTRGGWWYICRWMITSLHQCGQSLAFASFCNFLKSYFRFYERCDVDVIEKICWHSNLYLQFKKSPSPHPIAYIVSLKYIPSSIKLLHSLGSTFEHDNCFFFFYWVEKLLNRHASLYCYDRLPPVAHLVLCILLQW